MSPVNDELADGGARLSDPWLEQRIDHHGQRGNGTAVEHTALDLALRDAVDRGHRASQRGFGQGAEQGASSIRNNGGPIRVLAISRARPLIERVEPVSRACAKLKSHTPNGFGHDRPLALGIAWDVDPTPESHRPRGQ